MVSEEPKQSPQNPKRQFPKESENGEKGESMFSPRFKSVAAMAGWDEEALLIASLIVEDTPDRDFKRKKRSNSQFKSPPTTNSRRKRRAQKRSPISMSVTVLNLDEEQQTSREEREEEKKKTESKTNANEEKRRELAGESSGVSCSSSSLECIDRFGEEKTLREECEKKKTESKTNGKKMGEESSSLPCMNRLREELSCAICLDICFEPSTTPCGHSFCKKCLRSAADKCGKRCPKCRQLISNGRSCTVNTVLWNTIQLLFPQEVEARKAITATLNSREAEPKSTGRVSYYNARNRSVQALNSPEAEPQNSHDLRNRRVQTSGIPSRGNVSVRRRRGVPSQDEDAALALRLQREEFMEAFRGSDEQYSRSSSFSSARENLRAMATRAMNIRVRNRPT